MKKTARDTPFLQHVVAELWEVAPEILDNKQKLASLFRKFCKTMKLVMVRRYSYKFTPQGLTLLFVLAESHLAVHTWPEHGYMHIDLLSCDHKVKFGGLEKILKKQYLPKRVKIREVKYG